jgi:hypothetical protein
MWIAEIDPFADIENFEVLLLECVEQPRDDKSDDPIFVGSARSI